MFLLLSDNTPCIGPNWWAILPRTRLSFSFLLPLSSSPSLQLSPLPTIHFLNDSDLVHEQDRLEREEEEAVPAVEVDQHLQREARQDLSADLPRTGRQGSRWRGGGRGGSSGATSSQAAEWWWWCDSARGGDMSMSSCTTCAARDVRGVCAQGSHLIVAVHGDGAVVHHAAIDRTA